MRRPTGKSTTGGTDDIFPEIINNIKEITTSKDDDFLLMCIGETGTGKSHLSLHAMEAYLGENGSIDYYGLNRQSFASALKLASEAEYPRFCCNDEANINKRDAITKYNKKVIDLYMSIRGLNIFHWWNNPSIEMIDKHFIEEKIKGLIYIATKEKDRPRTYYYFTKQSLIKLFEKYDKLTLHVFKNKIDMEQHAYYKGFFKAYEGPLLKPYLEKKGERMIEKIKEFVEEFGDKEPEISKPPENMELTPAVDRKDLVDENTIKEGYYTITEIAKAVKLARPYVNNIYLGACRAGVFNREDAVIKGSYRAKHLNKDDTLKLIGIIKSGKCNYYVKIRKETNKALTNQGSGNTTNNPFGN